MQCSRSKHFDWHRVHITSFGFALLAAAVLTLAYASPAMAATLDRVRQTGKLTLGYRLDARPFAYRDETGNANGYRHIVRRLARAKAEAAARLVRDNKDYEKAFVLAANTVVAVGRRVLGKAELSMRRATR